MPDSCPRPRPLAVLLAVSLGGGCVIPMPVGDGDDDGRGSTDPTDSTAGGGTSTSEGPTSGPEPSGGSETLASDAGTETSGEVVPEDCDLWAQDCPTGYKCMARATEGVIWDDTHCAPIVADPDAVGEPCAVDEHPKSGLDTCELGAVCWDVDEATLEGTCVAMCGGSMEAGTCEDQGTACKYGADDAVPLCVPICDPLAQDCLAGEVCTNVPYGFACHPDASGELGGVGDPCEFINDCDPGNYCAGAGAVPGCTEGASCCTPYCDLTDPTPPCLPGQVCMSWYGDRTPPPEYADVGVCVVPG